MVCMARTACAASSKAGSVQLRAPSAATENRLKPPPLLLKLANARDAQADLHAHLLRPCVRAQDGSSPCSAAAHGPQTRSAACPPGPCAPGWLQLCCQHHQTGRRWRGPSGKPAGQHHNIPDTHQHHLGTERTHCWLVEPISCAGRFVPATVTYKTAGVHVCKRATQSP